MSESLKTGLSATRRVEIDAGRTISFMGDDCRVYSTPNLLYDIEMACRDLLLEHTEKGKDSVGTRIEISHSAATPIGMDVTADVELVEIDGRRLRFKVGCRDEAETIGDGGIAKLKEWIAKNPDEAAPPSTKNEKLIITNAGHNIDPNVIAESWSRRSSRARSAPNARC